MRSKLIIALFLLIGLLFPMEYSSSGAQRQGTFPGGQFALRASLSGRIPAREGSLPQDISLDPQGITTDAFLAYTFTGQVSGSREAVTLPAAVSATGADECTVTLGTLSYDAWERLTGESTTVGDGTATGSVSDVMAYSYDGVGRMTGRTYGTGTGAVSEALSYNVRSWLTGQSSPVFSSTLRYTDPSRSTTTGKYDGSISEWTWSRETGSTAQTYGFSYDGLGRLTGTKRYTDNGTTATNAFTEQGLVYDRNGNVTNVTRYGSSASSAEDIFTFTLTGNRISSLTNAGTNGSGVTYTSFTYDANGNTTHDGRTGQDLSWNMLNLIGGVSTTSGNTTTQLASYGWYADGTKYSAERPDGSGYVYKGNVIYEKAAGGALTLDCVLTTGGRIVANKNASGTITGYTVYHHITDHLGSVRAITDAGTGTVVETSDFLPFGTRWSLTSGSSTATVTDAANRWRYSGKEEQKAINAALPLIDYGARMYDPAIARWMSVDPMAEKYYPMGGYNYCAGNPVKYIDSDGRKILLPKGTTRQNIYLVLGNLQKLTDDRLVYSTQKDGTVRIRIASMGEGNKITGTRLIRRLNSSKHTMTIQIGSFDRGNSEIDKNSDNATNGEGTDVVVSFDPSSDPAIKTLDPETGCVMDQKRPIHIGLAHELIHGERSMRGEAINYKEMGTQTYTNSSFETVEEPVRKEEAATVGIKYHTKKDITENQIREEQGLNKRGAY